MKNFRFFSGLLSGVLLSLAVVYLIACKSEPEIEAPPSSVHLKDIESNVKAYKLEVDNIAYIVVINGREGGVAITRHQ